MSTIDPHRLDFATLSVLCLVHAKKSFSDAADALGTNQSTVSYTVDRLRKAFDDPLFVRQGGKIVATPRCEDLVIEARHILERFNDIVHDKEFDPSTSKTTLRISSNYYERMVILPRLIRALREQAPGVHLMMVPAQESGGEQLQRGEADVLLSPADLNLNGVYSKALLKDDYVCMIDKSNPLLHGEFTEEMFRAANHAYVSFAQIWRSDHAIAMRRNGLDVNRAVSISSPEDLASLLEGTDMIAVTPRRIARIGSARVPHRDCPFDAPFQVSMYWTARTHSSKMHIWLRNLIVQICAEVV